MINAENALAGLVLAHEIFAFVADPYSIWKVRYVSVIPALSMALIMPRTEKNVRRIRRLETQLALCEHYRRENNLHVMRRRLLAERCEV